MQAMYEIESKKFKRLKTENIEMLGILYITMKFNSILTTILFQPP